MVFRDRAEAGRELAKKLAAYGDREDVLVLALPRGGVPVAFEVAQALHAPLDVLVVRKLGVPGHEELAMGAIASGGVRVLNHDLIRNFQITPHMIDVVAAREHQELERRERLYRDDRPAVKPFGRIVLLVDDGMATGATMRVAVAALRKQHAERIVVAVPISEPETCEELRAEADETVCARTPQSLSALDRWYRDFSETSDQEVHDLLERVLERAPI